MNSNWYFTLEFPLLLHSIGQEVGATHLPAAEGRVGS